MKLRHLALTIYISLLLIAAFQVNGLPKPIETLSIQAEDLLRKFSIIPGLRLFYRPYVEDRKAHGTCISVKGLYENGQVRPIYNTQKSCPATGGIQWMADLEEVAFFRFIEEAALEHAPQAFGQETQVPKTLADLTPREAAIFQVLGDYFCHSQIPRRPEGLPLSIMLGFRQRAIDYKSGEISERQTTLLRYECAAHQIQYLAWDDQIDPKQTQAFLENQPW